MREGDPWTDARSHRWQCRHWSRDGTRAGSEGANVILTARNAKRLTEAATAIGAQRTASFDANDTLALASFFEELQGRSTI